MACCRSKIRFRAYGQKNAGLAQAERSNLSVDLRQAGETAVSLPDPLVLGTLVTDLLLLILAQDASYCVLVRGMRASSLICQLFFKQLFFQLTVSHIPADENY